MAKPRVPSLPVDPFSVHEDHDGQCESPGFEDMEEKRAEVEPSDSGDSSDYSDDSIGEVDESVAEDMLKLEDTFKGISQRFRLINRIGEGAKYSDHCFSIISKANLADRQYLVSGTFSTVYKAEDLLYEHYHNDWDIDAEEERKWLSPPLKKRRTDEVQSSSGGDFQERRQRRGTQFVAIKKIYVTSSPMRIQNELELLHDLRGCKHVCPLITAFRHQDQVVAVLPYFRHLDFRVYFREFTVPDMRFYFRSLFTALAAVHEHDIIHRDIKPTNFLYNTDRQRGVLVDFGLAEREETDGLQCICQEQPAARRHKIESSYAARHAAANGYPKNDTRPSRRANRAGTRGFRAPEVLLKCTSQNSKIDIWSAGIMLLTVLARRFPFFNSADDVEAMIEITTMFGTRKMKSCALLHGSVFETSIPTISEKGFSLEKIVLWATCRTKDAKGVVPTLRKDEAQAVKFLERLLELDPRNRISAREALEHEFLTGAGEDSADDDEMEMV
ncbi:MAG: hypothetical protein M1830_003472 [Pleopsidium flavum]|nr:MAG: hypothetical protein M1830_003472 [Pleopsidium flavum]